MTPPDPRAVYFGAGLFGWLHQPAANVPIDMGLVICNPFGFEEVCGHASLRHLAIAASAAGIPTLRFDYAGCGNSAGDEFRADTLGCWQRSVHEAVDGLKRASGVASVCLLGVRLGALLATLAACQRTDVVGMVVIAPVVSGRAYLRELTVLAQTGVGRALEASSCDLLESAGFFMTGETRDALVPIDLTLLGSAPAARVLIVQRDDLQVATKWPVALKRLGVEVTEVSWPGYARMMDDPQRAQVPDAIVAGVVSQLLLWRVGAAPALAAVEPWGSTSHAVELDAVPTSQQVSETAVSIDTGDSTMFGILSRPLAPLPSDGLGLLVLNSGSVHAIGPNRLWVTLGRRWALRGMTMLRIDVSGIGDSPPRPGAEFNVVYSPHAADDIAAALRFLAAQPGVTECHLMGLCSGAYHAFKAAVAGQTVASALMINPLTFFWTDGDRLSDVKDYEILESASKYLTKLLTDEPWRKLVRGQLDVGLICRVLLRRLWMQLTPLLSEAARRLRIPMTQDLARELGAAAGHGIELRFVFAAGAPGFAMLRQQSGGAIARLQARHAATLDFLGGADHTFTRLEARERLIQVLDKRMWPGHVAGHHAA